MTNREVMQMALDALKDCEAFDHPAYDALQKALAQLEPEPFAATTGYYGGHATLVPLNPADVVPSNLALYLQP